MDKSSKPDGRAKSSALQKGETSTWDKVKSAASAVTSSLGKVNPVGYPLSERISDKYKKNKADYRDKATKSKDEDRGKEVAKKPGAPAVWPFGKKTPGGAKLVKVKNKQTQRGKKIRTTPEWKKKISRAFNKTTKKISDKIQEPGKKGNRPGFD